MTNTNESKWRERYISENKYDACCEPLHASTVPIMESQDSVVYKVIEISALDELRTQLAAVEQELQQSNARLKYFATELDNKDDEITKLTEENARLSDEIAYYRLRDAGLTEKLRVAKEALKLCVKHHNQGNDSLLENSPQEEALAKLEGDK